LQRRQYPNMTCALNFLLIKNNGKIHKNLHFSSHENYIIFYIFTWMVTWNYEYSLFKADSFFSRTFPLNIDIHLREFNKFFFRHNTIRAYRNKGSVLTSKKNVYSLYTIEPHKLIFMQSHIWCCNNANSCTNS